MEKLKEISIKTKGLAASESSWELDERFGTSLITIDIESAQSVQESISSVFENGYDHKTIKKASKIEKKLIKEFGIQKNQMIYITVDGEILLFCAWWPWNDNSKVSLRIGLFALSDKVLDETESAALIKEWFTL